MTAVYLGFEVTCDDCGGTRRTKFYGSIDLKAGGWTSGLIVGPGVYRRTDRCPHCTADLGPVADVARSVAPTTTVEL